MKRSVTKMSIVIWSIVLVAAIALIVSVSVLQKQGGGFTMFGFFGSDNRADFVTVEDVSVKEAVNDIDFTWVSGNVIILKSGDDKIRVVQKAAKDFSKEKLLSCAVENGRLTVKDGRTSHRSFFSFISFGNRDATDLELYLPEKAFNSLRGTGTSADITAENLNLGDAKLNSVSGKLSVSGIFDSLDVNTTSGSINAGSCAVKRGLKASSTSGSINLTDSTANDIKANTTSGSIRGEGMGAASLGGGSVSGKIDLEGAFSQADCTTTSGSIHVDTTIPMSDAKLESTSGSVTLTVPENNGFTVKVRKTSGSFSCDFPTTNNNGDYVYNDGSSQFSMRSTSGSLRVLKHT